MIMRKLFQSLTLFVVLISFTMLADASTVQELDLPSLIKDANVILTGRVVKVKSFWNKKHTIINTAAFYRVEDVVMGSYKKKRAVVIEPYNGTVGNITQMAVGNPPPEVGDRYLLFLTPIKKNAKAYKIVGFNRGKFPIINRGGTDVLISNGRSVFASYLAEKTKETFGTAKKARAQKPQSLQAQTASPPPKYVPLNAVLKMMKREDSPSAK